MSADIIKPKDEIVPAPARQGFDWQAFSQWGCVGGALVIVLPLLLCAGVAAWLYFSTPTPITAQERPPVARKIPNCKKVGKRVYMQLGSGGKVIKFYCGA